MHELDPDPDERIDTAASSERPRTDGGAPIYEAVARTEGLAEIDERTVSNGGGHRSGGER